MKPLSEPQGEVTPPENDSASSDRGESFLREVTPDSSSQVVPVFLRVGEILGGRFAVHGFVQRGGMGTIYRAFDVQTGQAVAIKVLSCLDPDARERFAREAEILSELSHPGVVQHVAHGTIREGCPYLVMEWLHGEDLFQRLQRKALDGAESLAMLRRTCEALLAAHLRGIVHRDIKPANLFLANADPGCVKLLDFGVARLGDTVQSLTRRGNLLGTVGYMAPEQVRGEEDVDARADLFSLGCVLYECLTGHPPFESAYSFGVLAKVLHEEPRRPSQVSSGVDPRFDALVARLLAKNREERFPDAAAVLRELESFSERPSSSVRVRRLLSSAAPSEQKIVSVILGNSTEFRKPAQLLASFSACGLLDDLSRRFGAEVSTLKGGGILLVLSGRGEANDQASQAALCALGLQQGRPDLKLVVTTGLAETAGGITGAAIDRAAALLNEALPQSAGVFLDAVTAGLTALRFEIKCLGSFHLLQGPLQGLDTPHRLMGRPTPHVGRDREMQMLDGMLEECVTDSVSRMVLVTGPPGIGKSRLAGEWLARTRELGSVRTLVARGEPGASGPVALVKQLLRSAAGLREYDDIRAQRSALDALVQRTISDAPGEQLLPVLAEFLGIALEGEPTPIVRAVRASAEILREQVRRALHSWLDGETRQKPVLLVLEDLHWADSPSVSLLSESLRSLSERPLMILALARPEAEQLFSKLPSIVAVHVRLMGLAPRAAQQLIGAALDTNLPDAIVSRLVRTADGNAFYLEELIRRVAGGTTDWPDTVLAMAQSRIEQLKPSARTVLRAASVFGERCWDVAIQEIFDSLGDARHVLNLLAEEELLVRVSQSRYAHAQEYRFRHALLRDAAYGMMTDEERRVAHGLIGEWLERSGGADARALSDHYEAAGFSERALPYLVRAAKAAIDAGDINATIELADRGVGLGARGVARGRLLLLRSFAEFLRGPPNLMVTREAVDLLPIGTAAWWLGVGVLILGSCTYGRASEAMPYVTLAEDAPFTKEHDVPISQGLLTLVGGLVLLGKGDVAERIVDRAAAAAAAMTDEDPVFLTFLAAARCALASVAPVRGQWQLEEALYEGRRCSATLADLGALHGQFVVLYYQAIAAMHLGRYEEAREACERSVELNHQTGLNDGWPRLFLAKAYLRLNRPKDALDTVDALRSSPDWAVRQMVPIIVSEAYLRLGDAGKAETEATPPCNGVSPRLRRLAACVLARAQLELERPEEALNTADRALLVPSSNGLESDIELLTVRAEALHACGRLDEAWRAVAIASDLIDCIAEDIDDPNLKWSFLELVEPCVRARTLKRRLAEARGE